MANFGVQAAVESLAQRFCIPKLSELKRRATGRALTQVKTAPRSVSSCPYFSHDQLLCEG